MSFGVPKDKKLILFDGVCNLCNTAVQFIIKHDKKNYFLFTPLESDTGKKIIRAFHIDTNTVDSILLYSQEKGVHHKSTAALKIAFKLRFPIPILAIFLIVPRFIRDFIYELIAKNRYQWFGKKESCMIPTPELKNRFLD